MFYSLENGRIKEMDTGSISAGQEQRHIGVIGYDEIFATGEHLGVGSTGGAFTNPSPRFESHEGYDFLCLPLLKEEYTSPPDHIYVYFRENLLLFISDDPALAEQFIEEIVREDVGEMNLSRLLTAFLDRVTSRDIGKMDVLELEIMDFEDSLLIADKKWKPGKGVREIVSLRKKVMALKRYYEPFQDILDGIEENENRLFDKRACRICHILNGRVGRLFSRAQGLQEEVGQLRESYQAEVDIQLNTTMKIFTVLTAVFSPLTLIVGWYGMNFNMPEYGWAYGYPFAALLCAAAVILCLLIFKKNKWF